MTHGQTSSSRKSICTAAAAAALEIDSDGAAGKTHLLAREAAAWQRLTTRRARVDAQFRDWLDRHPDATPLKAKEALLTFLPDVARARLFDAFVDAAAQAPAATGLA